MLFNLTQPQYANSVQEWRGEGVEVSYVDWLEKNYGLVQDLDQPLHGYCLGFIAKDPRLLTLFIIRYS